MNEKSLPRKPARVELNEDIKLKEMLGGNLTGPELLHAWEGATHVHDARRLVESALWYLQKQPEDVRLKEGVHYHEYREGRHPVLYYTREGQRVVVAAGIKMLEETPSGAQYESELRRRAVKLREYLIQLTEEK